LYHVQLVSEDTAVTVSRALADGRAAFERERWAEAYDSLRSADAESPLQPEDLDRLATAAYLVGDDAASADLRARAHAGFLERGETLRAAASAFWLAFIILHTSSQRAQAAGWLARARRLIDEANEPCVEHGWLLCTSAFQRVLEGDFASAHAGYSEAAQIGERFRNADLIALARHGQARTLIMMRKTADGLALIDEVMVSVTSGEVGPLIAGMVYCSIISACHECYDLGRAQEWTVALQRWCAARPDVVPFRGFCLVRRSELMQMHGAWRDALEEARHACERLAGSGDRQEAGAAYYQVAELYRLRGEFDRADEAYRLASQTGRKPYPGLALLRLAQGQPEAADAAIRLALRETRGGPARVRLLFASVEIMIATRDIAGGRSAADELAEISRQFDAAYLRAVSSEASGAVALADGDADASLEPLRAASAEWRALDAPYELARVRTLIGLAYRQLGDAEGAQLELDAAQEVFDRLGATVDAARVAALHAEASPAAGGALTGREVEVLRLIATGATNRTIAGRLGISDKTVARHISNIFTKLDLPSRAAATAYAYEHHLV
jgi:DNA-binding CsgD family transcriptional regulator